MRQKILQISLALVLASSLQANAQYAKTDSTYRRWFVGSTLFLLGNLAGTNPPDFFQLNFGHRITGRDVITLEPKTWKYAWPNGIHPFLSNSYGKPEEQFPGYVREYGVSVSYQRFLWKGLYAELNVMPTLQNFVNNKGKKIDNGFQVFNLRARYKISRFEIWVNVLNATNEYFAVSAAKSSSGYNFNLGEPRTFNSGIAYYLGKK